MLNLIEKGATWSDNMETARAAFMAKDPDGNTLEFSFDQGVYATFQELAE